MKSSTMHTNPINLRRKISSSDGRGAWQDYLKQWEWFLLSLITMLVAGFVYIGFTEPVYRIQASVLVQEEPRIGADESIPADPDNRNQQTVVDNELEILTSNSLMKKVIDTLGLNVRYFHKTAFGQREIYDNTPVRLVLDSPTPNLYRADLHIGILSPTMVQLNDGVYPANQSVTTPFGRLRMLVNEPVDYANEPVSVQVMPDLEAIEYYLGKLQVEPSSDASTVLLLTFEDAVPAKGEAILNQIIANYHSAAIGDKSRMIANSLVSIQARLKQLSGEQKALEKSIEHYKSVYRIAGMGPGAQWLLDTLQKNDAQLSQLAVQLSALGDVEQYIREEGTHYCSLPAMLDFSDPAVTAFVTKIQDLERQRDRLVRTTSEANPIVQSITHQIDATKSSASETVAILRNSLTGTRNQLLTANKRFEARLQVLPTKERGLATMIRQQAAKNSLRTHLLQSQEATALLYATLASNSQVIDAATRSPEPIKPVKSLILAVFGAIGLLIPSLVFSLKKLFNKRVSSRDEISKATETPIIGEIAYVRHRFPIIVDEQRRSIAAEQIRALRTHLQFLRDAPNDSQVLLLTSSLSGEGKSFLALNLAASMALVGRRTVLLDLDLRHPKLHKSLHMLNFQGSSSYLMGDTTLEEVLQPVPGFDHLQMIACGPVPPNPSELLSGPRLGELIEKLRLRFDHIIIDAPPVGLVTDAQLIGPFADVTLYTVRHNVTNRSSLKLVDSLYQEKRFPKLNIVFNSVRHSGSSAHQYAYDQRPDDGSSSLTQQYSFY